MVKTTQQRSHPLSGKNTSYNGIMITPAAPAFKYSLRADIKDLAPLSKQLGLTLPQAPKTSTTISKRSALWLGPDEWLLIDEEKDPGADLTRSSVPHCAVDISHRSTALIVSGVSASDIINVGCPQDLSKEAFPIGACSRTVLGKIEIILLKTAEHEFRVECWRSYATYAFELLSTAAKQYI